VGEPVVHDDQADVRNSGATGVEEDEVARLEVGA
jgi:hypothetical protein